MNNATLSPGAFNYINGVIENLCLYSNTLATYVTLNEEQKKKFGSYTKNMKKISAKWASGMNKCLELNDINILIDFGNFLVNDKMDKYFKSLAVYARLKLLWSLLQNIPDDRVEEVINGKSSAGQSPYNFPLLEKIKTVTENTKIIVDSIVDRNYDTPNKPSILDIPAILLTIIIRSEAHEYTISKIIECAKKFVNNNIDSAEILSIQNKIIKGKENKPDTRAIRDATAHAKFKIESDSNNDYIIKFNNNEYGYSFIKEFSRKDLIFFYQDYERITILHTRLFTIRLLFAFLHLYYTT